MTENDLENVIFVEKIQKYMSHFKNLENFKTTLLLLNLKRPHDCSRDLWIQNEI